ncbi:MAG TPA: hypothetical protein VH328_06230, partial [Burkholderiaceae bacterium]|nr:hypothetical protein [Burkholderiaceae bacterium]
MTPEHDATQSPASLHSRRPDGPACGMLRAEFPSDAPIRHRRSRSHAITLAILAAAAATSVRAEPGHTPMHYFQAGIGTGLAQTQTTIDDEGTIDW